MNSIGLSRKSQVYKHLNVILEGSWTTFSPSSTLDCSLRNTRLDDSMFSISVIIWGEHQTLYQNVFFDITSSKRTQGSDVETLSPLSLPPVPTSILYSLFYPVSSITIIFITLLLASVDSNPVLFCFLLIVSLRYNVFVFLRREDHFPDTFSLASKLTSNNILWKIFSHYLFAVFHNNAYL